MKSLGFRFLERQFLQISSRRGAELLSDPAVQNHLQKQLDDSEVERAVALALDAPYLQDGRRDEKRMLFVVCNDYVSALTAGSKKGMFGASVHPYRRDAVRELERVVALGACLIKWLPSAQNIEPDHPSCEPFYEALEHFGVPLLCHTGSEHVVKAYPDSFSDPRRLKPALRRGVTVIAAHCGTRMLLHERCYFKDWARMAKEYENCYGDTAAFVMWTRLRPLRKILNDPELAAKLVFGTDYPVVPLPLSYTGRVGLRTALALRKIPNSITRTVATLKAAGVPDNVFRRGYELLHRSRESSAALQSGSSRLGLPQRRD